MKKTLIFAACLSCAMVGVAKAAPTDLHYAASADYRAGEDILSTSAWGYFWNLKNQSGSDLQFAGKSGNSYDAQNPFDPTNSEHTEGSVYKALTTEGNADYNLLLSGNVITMTVNEAVYFNKVTAENQSPLPASITLNLGSEGSITTAREFNIGNRDPRPSVTLSADFTAEKMAELISAAHAGAQVEYSRDLLVAKGNNGFWNLSDSYNNGTLTFTSDSLAASGLLYVGIKASADEIHFGEYGIVYTEASGKVNDNGVEYLTLVAKTPEPATATLSLLALAGLCARRRRH